MKYKIFLTLLVLLLQACNLPSNSSATETPTLDASEQSTPTELPTQTPLPTDTPPPTLSPTPSVPVVSPQDVAVNCRFGPGTAWITLSGLNEGESSQILGKNANGNWWYIVDPDNANRNCWVAASVTNASGDLTTIPVVQPPSASVTDVSIDIDPASLNVAGCIGPIPPIEINGTIETNGPTTVNWHFETQQGGAMSGQTVQFDTFGSKTFGVDYTPTLTAGTYWVRLIVTAPNGTQAETTYTITCP